MLFLLLGSLFTPKFWVQTKTVQQHINSAVRGRGKCTCVLCYRKLVIHSLEEKCKRDGYGKMGNDKIKCATVATINSKLKHAGYKKLQDLHKMLHLCGQARGKVL